MEYVVSENVEIILDNKRYLLEIGDKIVLEAYAENIDIRGVYEEIAHDIIDILSPEDKSMLISMPTNELLYAELKGFDQIKNLVRIKLKELLNRSKLTDKVMDDIFLIVKNMLDNTKNDWKIHNRPTKVDIFKK
jgi:hypothetical protein